MTAALYVVLTSFHHSALELMIEVRNYNICTNPENNQIAHEYDFEMFEKKSA